MSSRFSHAQHVFRMAALFILGIAAFLVARAYFVPHDFGVFGHYRASALDLNRDRPLKHAGQAACAECHTDIVEKRAGQRHQHVACEGCHAKDATRPATQPQVQAQEHAGDASCVSCHDPHAPRMS